MGNDSVFVRRHRAAAWLVAAILFWGAASAGAERYYVTVGGSGTGTGGWGNALGSIQAALNAAGPGDEIFITGGTYLENLTAKSGGWSMVGAFTGVDDTTRDLDNKTIVDGQYLTRVFRSDSGGVFHDDMTFDGIVFYRGRSGSNGSGVLTNGRDFGGYYRFYNCGFDSCIGPRNATSGGGGTVVLNNSSEGIFVNCSFTDNYRLNYGTGDKSYARCGALLAAKDDYLLIENCVFDNNEVRECSYSYGGVAMITSCDQVMVTSSTFTNNGLRYPADPDSEASMRGGVLYVNGETKFTLDNCVFDGNGIEDLSTSSGDNQLMEGGVLWFDGSAADSGCTITQCQFRNTSFSSASEDYISFHGGAIYCQDGHITIDQTVVEDTYCTFAATRIGGEYLQGGGIYIHDNASSFIMDDSIVRRNSIVYGGPSRTYIYGGGVYVSGGSGGEGIQAFEVTNSRFEQNRIHNTSSYSGGYNFQYGAGMYVATIVDPTRGLIENCDFVGNEHYYYGGYTRARAYGMGLHVHGTVNLDVTDCDFSGNWGWGRNYYYRGAVAVYSHHASSPVQFTRCRFMGNHGSHGGAFYMDGATGPGCGSTLTNCIIAGNGNRNAGGAFHIAGDDAVNYPIRIVNCSIVANTSWSSTQDGTAMVVTGTTPPDGVPIVNSIIVGNRPAAAFYEAQDTADIRTINCLYFNNGMAFRDKDTDTEWADAAEVNANVNGCQNNLDGKPLFLQGPEGQWTNVAPAGHLLTRLETSGTPWTAGELVGTIVNLDPSGAFNWSAIADQPRYACIKENTENAIVVYGDFTNHLSPGDAYEFVDLRLRYPSTAIDQGVSSHADVTVPNAGYDGDARTADVLVIPNAFSTWDIGAFEFVEPLIRVTPLSLDFGTTIVQLGASAPMGAIIENIGSADLSFDSVGKIGADHWQFENVTLPALTDLAPGDPARLVELAFNPSAAPGDYTAWFQIQTNDPDEPTTQIELHGIGVANAAPVFANAIIERSAAQTLIDYGMRLQTLAGEATDANSGIGDALTYAKVTGTYSGPGTDWLDVAGDGALSGIPVEDNIGENQWTVQVEDLRTSSDQATLVIDVINAPPGSTVRYWGRY